MECDICGREGALHCVTCARTFLEKARGELAQELVVGDTYAKHVRAVVEGLEDKESQYVSLQDSKGGLLVDRQECTNHIEIQRTRAETAEIEERTALINEQAELLRRQIDDARKKLAEKRRQTALRRSDISSATHDVDVRRANERDKIQQSIKRLGYESDKVHASTMEMRSYLVNSAADIAGLKSIKRRTKDGEIKETFYMGPDIDRHRTLSKSGRHVRIWDLLELNDAPPDEVSASLLAVTQLLIRVTAYLGLRLPSEITLPHKDYPHPTITSPEESWEGKKAPFPGLTPSHSSSNSPEASRTLDGAPMPRAMVLYLDRSLPHLREEDKAAYATFIEAVAHLGYNVAWLCRSQGMKDEIATWEGACDMGKNLHRLLKQRVTWNPQRPENPLDKDIPQSKSSSNASKKTPVGLGEVSCSTSHSFALDGENVDRLGDWKVTPWKLNDQLKSFLYAEEQTKDWDNLDPKEWADMENAIKDDPVMVGKRHREGDGKSIVENLSTIAEAEAGDERKRGVNGWTRVKSRSEEPAKKPAPE
ncbi:uncharacterized protein N0V89_011928 [Didymosphaeria variabile]|uniref:Autophagy-related protein 14 n=1 Tax=Didymosphaeria variabile TaxID=1932322 RepID=A0A9W8XC66_9PLEO|nr:uncharacterized protein N0V89_011928 [Didymosphaeria variabile]KAJ4345793.1 hypothetical protein N0V89_011928 [Didymosphaeria variabile]